MTDRYASLKQGLVGCWIPSVSGSGLLLPDLSGRGNNGSLVGMDASDWVSSSVGRVLNFGLYSAKIPTCKDSPTLNITSDKLSLSVFVNNLNSNEWQGCFHKCNSNTPGYQLFITDANKIAFGIDTTVSGFTRLTGGTLPSGVCHLACVYDGQQMITYINGRLDTSTTKTGNITDSSGIDLILNASRFAQQSIVSWATDWRVYNRPLTTSEVAILASEPGIGFKRISSSAFATRYAYKPAKPRNYSVIRNRDPNYSTLRQGLVAAYCPSISGQGNVLPDLVGGNHGTLTNMSAGAWVSSGSGRAISGDGSDDVIVCNSQPPGINGSRELTVSFWASGPAQSLKQIVGNFDGLFAISFNVQTGFAPTDGLIAATSTVDYAYTGSLLSSTTLRHFCFVFNGSLATKLACYADGVQVNLTFSGTFPATIPNGSPTLTMLATSGGTRFFNGNIDDVRYYNRALTEPEIRLLASRPGIGLRQESHRNTFYQFPSGSRRRRILTGMP